MGSQITNMWNIFLHRLSSCQPGITKQTSQRNRPNNSFYGRKFIINDTIKKLKAKYLVNKQHNGFHLISFVMYIFGAKFEERRFNISGDILDSVY